MLPMERRMQAKNAAKHKGISMNSLLSPVICEYLDALPERYRKEYDPT